MLSSMGYGRPWVDQWCPDPEKGLKGFGARGGERGSIWAVFVTPPVLEATFKPSPERHRSMQGSNGMCV